MTTSNEELGKLLTENEKDYKERSEHAFIPISFAVLKKMHDYYKEEKDDNSLKSVWVDKMTILHLAHFILTHGDSVKQADGVRVYLEKFDEDRSVPGKTFTKGVENMAFMITYKGDGLDNPEHLDWLGGEQEQAGADDKFAADNYNDPDPPKNSGSTL